MQIFEWVENLVRSARDAVPEPLLQQVYGNSWLRVIVAGATALLVAATAIGFTRWLRSRIRSWTGRTQVRWDDGLAGILDSTSSLILFLASVLAASSILDLPETWDRWTGRILLLCAFVQLGLYGRRALSEVIELWEARSEDQAPQTLLGALRFAGNVVIWSTLLLVLMSTLGIEISALLAGLGVGGVAAALAAQSMLGDVFSAVSLYTDRPFDIGDFIATGDDMGTVLDVGWRTTRVRSLGGELLVYPNSDLTGTRIQNYNRMTRRRVRFDTGVVYATPTQMLDEIPKMIRQAVEAVDGVTFDRAHFKGFGASSLDFETVYYVEDRDYGVHMQRQHEILVGVMERLRDAEVEIAFPTRSLHLESVPRGWNQHPASEGDAEAEQLDRAS